MNLHVQETFVNEDRQGTFGESEVYATPFEAPGELFRSLQSEWGRCVSKVYIDRAGRGAQPIGWVFESIARYDDTGEPYKRHVWARVHLKPPTVTTTYHYADLEKRVTGGEQNNAA
jgi:hypothetical protein